LYPTGAGGWTEYVGRGGGVGGYGVAGVSAVEPRPGYWTMPAEATDKTVVSTINCIVD